LYYLHSSDRSEHLLLALQAVLQQPLKDLWQPEVIVVQNTGMARWLTHRLAEQQGIAAHLNFPLPSRSIWDLLQKLLSDVPEHSSFERDAMLWQCLQCLPDLLPEEGFEPLQHYLQQRQDSPSGYDLALYQLCSRIAELFDQYLVYRPDEFIQRWQSGAESHWQAKLWRALCAAQGQRAEFHRAALLQRLEEHLNSRNDWQQALPERLCLFGLSAMTPVYMRLLQRLAEYTEVHFFVLNPSLEYWGDSLSPKRFQQLKRRQRQLGQSELPLSLHQGNPLLTAFGRQTRDFIQLLQQVPAGQEFSYYRDDEAQHCLGQIQDAIVHNRAGAPYRADSSLQIHRVHSRFREIQVLHEQLLTLFAESNKEPWQLQDIVVMVPDISQYVGAIRAVWDASDDERFLDYRIADLQSPSQASLHLLWLDWLQLPQKRCSQSEVLGWLQVPALQRRFHLPPESMSTLKEWVTSSQIHWGLNAQHRADLGQPETHQNTWAFGLERLLLGWCLDDQQDYFQSRRALHQVQGLNSEWLGSLAQIVRRLDFWRQRVAQPRSWPEWQSLLLDWFNDMLDCDEQELEQMQDWLEALQASVDAAAQASFEQPVSLSLVREHLQKQVQKDRYGSHFLSGRITFCNMMPMRSIPFRMVCLLGLNDKEFPRQTQPQDFDLMAQHPRQGDRNPRDEDRTLFLEALMAARQRLYLSYTGMDQRSNQDKPASVLLQELLQHLEDNGLQPSSITTSHPLQAFDRSCFMAPEPQSFAHDWMPKPVPTTPESQGPIAHAVVAETDLPQQVDLAAFLKSPPRYFVRQHYQLYLPERIDEFEDEDPFILDPLGQYHFRQQWLLHHEDFTDAQILAEGKLPNGLAGQIQLQQLRQDWQKLRDTIASHCALDSLRQADRHWSHEGIDWYQNDIDCNDDFAAIALPWSNSLKAWRLVQVWVQHLLAAVQGDQRPSLYLHIDTKNKQFKTETYRFHALSPQQAQQSLAYLQSLWRQGWQQPLAFLPQTAWEAVHAVLNDAAHRQDRSLYERESAPALQPVALLNQLYGSEHSSAELDEESALLFPEDSLLNDTFAETAWQLYGRLLRECDYA